MAALKAEAFCDRRAYKDERDLESLVIKMQETGLTFASATSTQLERVQEALPVLGTKKVEEIAMKMWLGGTLFIRIQQVKHRHGNNCRMNVKPLVLEICYFQLY